MSLTAIESLRADTGDLKGWMLWNFDLLIPVIRGWHPERQTTVVD